MVLTDLEVLKLSSPCPSMAFRGIVSIALAPARLSRDSTGVHVRMADAHILTLSHAHMLTCCHMLNALCTSTRLGLDHIGVVFVA